MIAILFALCAEGCARATSGTDSPPSPSPTLPITAGNYPGFGHAVDFSWVAGKLVRSAPAGQCAYIVFSTRRGEPWGGRVALYDKASAVDRFPDGDMVVVTGALNASAPSTCGEPALAVETIEEH